MAYPQVTTVVSGNTVEVTTTQRLAPTIQTVVSADAPTITTIVESNWDGIWSINGQTGDVILTFSIDEFQPNTAYPKNSAVIYDGSLWVAKQNVVSGATFDPTQWSNMSGNKTASQVSYDNSSSDIPSTTVQGAIDYLHENGGGLQYIVVEELPTEDIDERALYLVPKS